MSDKRAGAEQQSGRGLFSSVPSQISAKKGISMDNRLAAATAAGDAPTDSIAAGASFNGVKMNSDQIDPKYVFRVKAADAVTGNEGTLSYTNCRAAGKGSFGEVFQTLLVDTGEDAAIKTVLQDRRFKNRELQIMRLLSHPSICTLKYFFYSQGEKEDELFLNLVLEYMPENLYRAARHYIKSRQSMPVFNVKLYMYQLFRALSYMHPMGVCHRDIKPQNLLLNPATGVLKLCDFGSAKILVKGEPNVAYICSRYYRAPELIFGATDYTTSIDIWSTGCVVAELLLGRPIFPGRSAIDQLVEIIKVLGTPTRDQIKAMNSNYMDYKFPEIKSQSLQKMFRPRTTPEAISLLEQVFEYIPGNRPSALEAICHPFFDDLRSPNVAENGSSAVPDHLFDFSEQELHSRPDLVDKLLPPHVREARANNDRT